MNKPYYEKTFAMPRTLGPDKLGQSKKRAHVKKPCPRSACSPDGTHTVELYHVPEQSTTKRCMLIAYLPKEKILVEADLLYSPARRHARRPVRRAPIR